MVKNLNAACTMQWSETDSAHDLNVGHLSSCCRDVFNRGSLNTIYNIILMQKYNTEVLINLIELQLLSKMKKKPTQFWGHLIFILHEFVILKLISISERGAGGSCLFKHWPTPTPLPSHLEILSWPWVYLSRDKKYSFIHCSDGVVG